MRSSRSALLVTGISLVAVGAADAWQALDLVQLAGLAMWLAGAIALHDALLAPGGALMSRMLERHCAGLAPASRGIIRAGFVVGVVLTVVALPAIISQSRGTVNPTILTRPYASILAFTWCGLVVLVGMGVVVAQRCSNVRNP